VATIREVAKAAGVSTATVSNVLNGRSDRVSSATKDRVLATVRQLKYRPTPMEKDQKAIMAQNIGLLVPNLKATHVATNSYFHSIFDGVLESAAVRGWSVTIFVQNLWYDSGKAIRRSYDGRCDGLILIAPQKEDEIVGSLVERGTPLLMVGSTPWFSGVSCVDIDNRLVGETAFRHLFNLGHRSFAFLGEVPGQVSSFERRSGFFDSARASKVPEECLFFESVSYHRDDLDGGVQYLRKLISRPEAPTGIFCWHDRLATFLVRAAKHGGFRIPQDFSILSVDNSDESQTCDPPLTTFVNPLLDIGRRAGAIMVDALTHGSDEVQIVRLPSQMLVRESTGPAPVK
jgi:DNA-binding LacI/PurR family transcriptional regulator